MKIFNKNKRMYRSCWSNNRLLKMAKTMLAGFVKQREIEW